jgi:hypothetical protein
MILSFSTLGCPNWNLATICTRGQEYGFSGVDFRGYLNDLDITLLPEFTSSIASTRRQLDDAVWQVVSALAFLYVQDM